MLINSQSLQIKREKKNRKNSHTLAKKDNKEIIEHVRIVEQEIQKGTDIILPLLSYHGTGRLWEQENKKSSTMENLKRLDGYNDALNAKSNYRNFKRWFEN